LLGNRSWLAHDVLWDNQRQFVALFDTIAGGFEGVSGFINQVLVGGYSRDEQSGG